MAISKKGWYWIFGIISFGLLGTGVTVYVKRQVALLLDFCYKIDKFKFTTINNTNLGLSFILNIRNQSDISVEIKKYFFDIFLNDIKIASISNDTPQTWAKQSVTPLNINVNVKWKDVGVVLSKALEIVKYYFTDKSKIVLKISGNLSAKAVNIPTDDYPVTMKFTLPELLAPSGPSTCKI